MPNFQLKSFSETVKLLTKEPKEFFGYAKNAFYEVYSKDPAKMMVHTGTIGWTLSSAAQLWNVATDDKYTSKDKKFLIPQEALDAAINIFLFYSLTNICKNISGKLVSTGKLLSKDLLEHITKNPKGCKLGDFGTNLKEIYAKDEDFLKKFIPFKNGVDMAVNTVACIVASNLITPYVRNAISAWRQKVGISKEKENLITIEKPVLSMHKKPEANGYLAKTPYPTNSGMKI